MIELHREAEARAFATRAQLGIGSEPVPDIITVLEGAGLIVFVQPWGSDGPAGAYLPRGDRKYIFLNAGEFLPRFRFTGAHELGHHMFHDGPQLDVGEDLSSPTEVEERRANSFAASFLMPRDGISVALGAGRRRIASEDVRHLATHFGVSYLMATYRLHNTGLINAARRDELVGERTAVLTPEFRQRVQTMRHLPSKYVENAFEAYLDSRITFDRLAHLLRVDAGERLTLAHELRQRDQLHEDDEGELGITRRR